VRGVPSQEEGHLRPGRALDRDGRRRAIAGAAVGGGLNLVAYLVLRLPNWSSAFGHPQCPPRPWGCLGLVIVGIAALQLGLVVLPWPLLRAAGVRPAWPSASVAILAVLAGFVMYGSLTIASPVRNGLWPVVLSAALYGASALVTGVTWPKRGRILAVACIIVLYPVAAGLTAGYGLPAG
jgi:hypothetical protein